MGTHKPYSVRFVEPLVQEITIVQVSTNKSLPRWGKVAHRLTEFIKPKNFGVVTDEVVMQTAVHSKSNFAAETLSVSFQLTPLPRGEAWLCAPREKDVAVYSGGGTTLSPIWIRRNVTSDLKVGAQFLSANYIKKSCTNKSLLYREKVARRCANFTSVLFIAAETDEFFSYQK